MTGDTLTFGFSIPQVFLDGRADMALVKKTLQRAEELGYESAWVQDQVDRGLIKREEARGHPLSNLITRAIGVDATPSPNLYSGTLQDGDVFLLTSDGLTDLIDDQRIAELLSSDERLEEAAERLITEANEAGGLDNITAVIVRVKLLEP